MASKQRANGEGSVFQRQDGRWAAAITLAGGKRKHYIGRRRSDVARELAAATRDRDRGLPIVTQRQTLAQFLDMWLRDCVKSSVRPRTHASYGQLTRNHIVPALGKTQLAKLTPQQIQRLLNDKLASGLSARTVQYLRAVLRAALKQALKWGLVAQNVAVLTTAPRVTREPVTPLDPDQARQLLLAVRGDRLEALIRVALAIGLRQSEALGLAWDDVDLGAGSLRVRHALQRVDGQLRLVEPKTALSRRTIALPESVCAALREHWDRQQDERRFAGSRWKDSGLVFTSTIGTPLEGRNVTRRFQQILYDAGLPRQRFHDLRHGCASLLLAQGVNPRVVMEILGHSQISLTLNTYSHVIPSLQREAMARMDDVLGEPERARLPVNTA